MQDETRRSFESESGAKKKESRHSRRCGDHERVSDAAYLAAANQGNPDVEFRQRGETLPAPKRTKYLRGNGGRVPTIGMKNGTRLREAHVAQAIQQAAEEEENKRREMAALEDELPAYYAHLK